MATDELHTDRARAESFGSVAGQYDRYRPAHPDALMDDLAALRPAAVLDIGCGTGKAAVALARRGLRVLGVEPDERMAEVARGHGVQVEIADFETWADAGRRFDLITCGDAWHWIDPGRGVPKAARLLRKGGTIARFWTYHMLDEPVVSAIEGVYRRCAPELRGLGRAVGNGRADDPFTRDGAFSPLETRTYRWERLFSAGEWARLAATHSDHRNLGPARLATLQLALHAALETLGGTIHAQGGTQVRLARRA